MVIGRSAKVDLSLLFKQRSIAKDRLHLPLILKPVGLVLSTIVFMFLCAYGGHEFKWKEVAWLSIGVTIFTVLIFVKLLGQPFPIWPSFID